MIYKINIINKSHKNKEKKFLKKWKIKHDNQSKFSLILKPNRIELKNNTEKKFKNIYINFNYKRMQFYKNNKSLTIAKAIGIKKNYFPIILDATAGFGKDSFIFFSLGCQVYMVERHPILAALLYDGLKRGYQDQDIGHLLKKKIQLIYNSSINIKLFNIITPDVIYLDPMFPKYKKNALSKKHIRTIRNLVKKHDDSILLLETFKAYKAKKIVVKRPIYSDFIGNYKPNYIMKMKKHRFDIYLNKIINVQKK